MFSAVTGNNVEEPEVQQFVTTKNDVQNEDGKCEKTENSGRKPKTLALWAAGRQLVISVSFLMI